MTLEANENERPDVFGPYFLGMERIHKVVLDYIKSTPAVKQQTVMVQLQCNFAEYVHEDHDNNYWWKELRFGGDPRRSFAVGTNEKRLFADKARQEQLISVINGAWTRHGFEEPVVIADIAGVTDLSKDPWEMILSIHFYFPETDRDDDIPDTQYCKIVYTRSSLSDYMERIRLT